MPERCTWSVVLPAYLEDENLRLLLPRIRAVMERLEGAHEIIVVDTVTPLDATQATCEANNARYVVRKPTNSFGDAVRTGLEAAGGQWIIFMDADGSHAPEFIPSLVAHVPDHDIVIASRYTPGGYTDNGRMLVFMSRVLNLSYSIVLNLRCKDVSNSFKVYRADWLKSVSLRCANFDIVEEILYKLVRHHPDARIMEVPFSFKKRMFGETKRNLFAFMLTYLFTIVRLRIRTD